MILTAKVSQNFKDSLKFIQHKWYGKSSILSSKGAKKSLVDFSKFFAKIFYWMDFQISHLGIELNKYDGEDGDEYNIC